jgi:ketosteroid isomerase-like protein
MSRENVETVRAVFEEWGKGNLRAGADLFDPHIVFITAVDLPDAGRYFGTDSVRQWIREFVNAWASLTLAAEELIEAGDTVVVTVNQRGVGKESSAPGEVRYFQVWTFRGRSVIRIENFRDRAQALEAAGLEE